MKLNLTAYHLETRLDLSQFRSKWGYELVKREHSFLLFKLSETSFMYLKDYGSIVFLGCYDSTIKSILRDMNITKIKDLPKEVFNLELGRHKTKVDFGTIYVNYLYVDLVHVIMLNMAQSVALMNYVNKTSELHDGTLVYSKQLEKTGTFKLKRLKMRKFIGKTMNLKNNIAENLFVFDTPDVAWSNKELTQLDYMLKGELDIVNRFEGIKNSLDTIKENLDLFSDILQHKYSSMLEWIIIGLILFEVIQVILEKL